MKVKLPVNNGHFRFSSAKTYCKKGLLVYNSTQAKKQIKTYLIAYRTDYPDFETAERCQEYVDDSKEG